MLWLLWIIGLPFAWLAGATIGSTKRWWVPFVIAAAIEIHLLINPDNNFATWEIVIALPIVAYLVGVSMKQVKLLRFEREHKNGEDTK